ncbi:type IV pilus modification PilV family protein [Fibrobacter sp. UBA4309]|uniref:type IV pilus modification PilV family protein n=1 Tax=Fibrobacter sp. UBA4309 TaxID=1946537 RepID=UPI0025B98C4E|nr:type II secretion system protein [Fibrobacter sp. UBA4309]
MEKVLKNKKGFGITEVLVSALVLGLLYMAVLHMQTGNREALLRIRGRDGAVEVAQQVLDSLNRIGIASIPSDPTSSTSYTLDPITRSWDRGSKVGGGNSFIEYTPTVTVSPTNDYVAENTSSYESVSHVYAKQVNVKVSWNFKGSTQSIDMSAVIR